MSTKILRQFDAERVMSDFKKSFEKSWYCRVHIFVWLNVIRLKGVKFQLSLEVEDQFSCRKYPVDYCLDTDSHSILLNNTVSIAGKGVIKSMLLKLHFSGCDHDDIIVDDISLKAVHQKESPSLSKQATKAHKAVAG